MNHTARLAPVRTEAEPTKRQPRRHERAWIHAALLFAALVLFVSSVFGEQGLADSLRARRQIRASQASLSSLRTENGQLRERIRRLREDPRTIEDVARQDLGLIRRGEILVIVKDKKP